MDINAPAVSRGAIPRWLAIAISAVTVLSASIGLGTRAAPAATVVVTTTSVLGWSPGVARNVPLSVPLGVYFNRAMDRASVERAWSLSPSVAGTFRWSGTSVSFRPARALRPGSIYRLSIGATARSTTGVPLGATFSVRFATGDALRVVSYSPRNGTQGVPA